jgi:hypothetical protein
VGFVHLSAAFRTAFFELLRDALAAGSIKVYAGTVPASVDTPITDQVLRATLVLTDPAGQPPAAGSWNLTPIDTVDAVGSSSAVPSFARIVDSDGVGVFDADVGLMASSASLRFDTLTFAAGADVRLDSALLRF